MRAARRMQRPRVDDAAVARLVRTIERSCGLVVDEWRLPRALEQLAPEIGAAGSLEAFCDRVQREPARRQAMIEALCVHETRFFRHPSHFDHLGAFFDEGWGAANAASRGPQVWSVAAASGEEPYSIAMTVHERVAAPLIGSARVTATDISGPILRRAERAVYPETHADQLTRTRLERFFLRGVGNARGQIRVCPGVRDLVAFSHLNLVDARWPIEPSFDAVFCRNVLIYFGPEQRAQIGRRLLQRVRVGGLLVLGPSENIRLDRGGVESLAPSVLRRTR